MWRATVEVTIGVPIERAFAYVADLTRHGEWSPTPLRIEPVTAGPVEPGARFRSWGETRGREVASEVEVNEVEPHRLFAFTATSPSTVFRHAFTFTPEGDGVRVARTLTRLRAVPLVRLVGPLLNRRVLVPSVREGLALLARRLESGAA